MLKDNGSDSLTVSANGSFTFPTALNSGSTYAVSISTQPSGQRCVIANGTGSGTANANVTSVSIACSATGTVGQYLWTTNPFDANGNGSVAALTITAATGALTAAAGSPYVSLNNGTTENQPYGLALDPSGTYLYVVNSGCAAVSVGPPVTCTTEASSISIDQIGTGGVLTVDSASAVAAGSDATNVPDTLIVDATGSGNYLFSGNVDPAGAGGQIQSFSITGPGALTSLSFADDDGPSTNGPKRLAIDTTNQIVFSANPQDGSLIDFSVNPSTGALTGLNAFTTTNSPNGGPTFNAPYAIALWPAGTHVYAVDYNSNVVWAFSYDAVDPAPALGNLTLINSYPVGTAPTGIAIDPTGNFLYVSNSGDGTVSGFQINSDGSLVSLGSAVTVSGVASTTTPTAVAIDPSSQYLYVANGDSGTVTAFVINFDGSLTPVGGTIASGTLSVVGSGGGPSAILIE